MTDAVPNSEFPCPWCTTECRREAQTGDTQCKVCKGPLPRINGAEDLELAWHTSCERLKNLRGRRSQP